MSTSPYPVAYAIDPPERYNRWTVAFRPILAIPQLLLTGSRGALTAVLALLSLFAWFAILFTGRYPAAMRDVALLLFRWTQNVDAYVALQAAPYPPFGAGAYPLRLQLEPAPHYNRWTVAFRLVLILPHVLVLAFLLLAQAVVTVIAWFAILFTGRFPAGMFRFSVGVSRWGARVIAYLYLFVDEYPPFTTAAEPQAGGLTPQPA